MSGLNKSASPGLNMRLRHYKGTLCNLGCTPGCSGSQLCPRVLRSLQFQFKCGSKRTGFARLGEPIYRRFPSGRKQQSHWHVAPGHGGDERPGSITKSRCDLFRRSAICHSARILVVSVASWPMQYVQQHLLPSVRCQRLPDQLHIFAYWLDGANTACHHRLDRRDDTPGRT
jgi:hypothetical protein